MSNHEKFQHLRIKISMQPFDYSLEVLAVIGLLFLLGIALWHYPSLPETVPVHFGSDGKPDSFSSKTALWFLPGLGIVIYGLANFLNNRPHLFNYPVAITPENAERRYTFATRFIRALKMLVVWLFAHLTLGTVTTANGQTEGLSSAIWVFLVAIVILTFGYLYKSFSQR